MLKQNFLYFTSGPLLPVLSLGINEKSFALSPPCIPMGIQTQFYLFQWKEMRELCGMPGCLWCPAVYFQKKPWEYSLTLWYKNKRHCLAQAMSHKLLEAGTTLYKNITVLGLLLYLLTDFGYWALLGIGLWTKLGFGMTWYICFYFLRLSRSFRGMDALLQERKIAPRCLSWSLIIIIVNKG